MVDIADLETRRLAHARRIAHANRTAWRHPQRQPHPTGLGIRVRLARVLRALAARLDPPALPVQHAPNMTPLAL